MRLADHSTSMIAKPSTLLKTPLLLYVGLSSGEMTLAEESAGIHPFLTDTWIVQLGVYSPHRDIKFGLTLPWVEKTGLSTSVMNWV